MTDFLLDKEPEDFLARVNFLLNNGKVLSDVALAAFADLWIPCADMWPCSSPTVSVTMQEWVFLERGSGVRQKTGQIFVGLVLLVRVHTNGPVASNATKKFSPRFGVKATLVSRLSNFRITPFVFAFLWKNNSPTITLNDLLKTAGASTCGKSEWRKTLKVDF